MRVISAETLKQHLSNMRVPSGQKKNYIMGFNEAQSDFRQMIDKQPQVGINHETGETLIDADEIQRQLLTETSNQTGYRKYEKDGLFNYANGYKDALLRFKSMVHSAPTVSNIKHSVQDSMYLDFSDLLDLTEQQDIGRK